jgi:hydrogenase small subunit
MASTMYGKLIRSLRKVTLKTVDEEPKWRVKGTQLLTGYKQDNLTRKAR